MDAAIKALWYDIAGNAREDFLAWLDSAYLPVLRARPGYVWVAHYRTVASRTGDDRIRLREADDPALGRGTQFLLLIGATNVDLFFSSEEAAFNADMESRGQAMLAQRTGERLCIYAEESRLNGPEYPSSVVGVPAPVIQLGSFNTPTVEDALELGNYYRQNRFPAVARSPGCIRARKLLATVGWARHGILYEFTSLDSRRDHFEELVEWGADPKIAKPDNPYLWPGRFPTEYVVFAPGAPTVAERIWP